MVVDSLFPLCGYQELTRVVRIGSTVLPTDLSHEPWRHSFLKPYHKSVLYLKETKDYYFLLLKCVSVMLREKGKKVKYANNHNPDQPETARI